MKKLSLLVSNVASLVSALPASGAQVTAAAGEALCNQDAGNAS